MEYSIGTSKGDADNEKILREAGFECIPYSAYKALLEAQGRTKVLEHLASLNKDECILIKYQPEPDNNEADSVYPLLIGNHEIPVTVTAVTLDNPISFANSVGTLIVSDDLYHMITEQAVPAAKVLSINGKSIEDNEALFQALSEYLSGSPYLQGNSHRVHDIFFPEQLHLPADRPVRGGLWRAPEKDHSSGVPRHHRHACHCRPHRRRVHLR